MFAVALAFSRNKAFRHEPFKTALGFGNVSGVGAIKFKGNVARWVDDSLTRHDEPPK